MINKEKGGRLRTPKNKKINKKQSYGAKSKSTYHPPYEIEFNDSHTWRLYDPTANYYPQYSAYAITSPIEEENALEISVISNNTYLDKRKGRKYGETLLNEIINYAIQMHYKKIYLGPTDTGSGKLYQFYYNNGFRCLNDPSWTDFTNIYSRRVCKEMVANLS